MEYIVCQKTKCEILQMLNVFLFSDHKLYHFNEKCSVAELTFEKIEHFI